MSCAKCGMYLPDSPAIWDETTDWQYRRVEGPVWHECPEPFDPQTARWLFDFHSSSGIPVSGRTKARIMLGLS